MNITIYAKITTTNNTRAQNPKREQPHSTVREPTTDTETGQGVNVTEQPTASTGNNRLASERSDRSSRL